jgi:N-acylneuraminate cytidylyltransferase
MKMQNERLPGKNVRDLCGYPLYAYLFSSLKKLKDVDQVFVDSSDETMLGIAREWGFSTLKRPVELDGPGTTGDELISRVIETDLIFDLIALLHVTSPFLTPETILRGFQMLEADGSMESVFGVTPHYNRFWFQGQPVNHDIQRLQRTQDLTPVLEESDVYFFRREAFIKYRKRICGRFGLLEMSAVESLDLDELPDFSCAEAYIKEGLVSVSPEGALPGA